MTKTTFLGLIVSAVVTVTGAQATTVIPTFSTFGALPDATFGGTDISNQDVAITTILDGSNTITLGLTANQRFSENPSVTNDGAGTFTGVAGLTTPPGTTIPGATWSFNYFIDIAGGGQLTDYNFELLYDFDPSAGTDVEDLGVLSGNSLAFLSGDTDAVGNINPNTTRLEGSQNLAFDFLSTSFPGFIIAPGVPFDATAIGEYSFLLSATDLGGDLLGSSGINVNVVPVPLPAALPFAVGGLGLLGLLSYRRKKKGA